jgi:hypothetical protein
LLLERGLPAAACHAAHPRDPQREERAGAGFGNEDEDEEAPDLAAAITLLTLQSDIE